MFFKRFACWGLLLAFTVSVGSAQIPDKATVLAKMELANNYFMSKWPDPTMQIVSPDKTRPSNIWTRSTYYEGLMAMYRINPLIAYYNYAVDWGVGHKWELAWGGITSTHSDNQCCGQTYIELYQIDQKSNRIAGIKNAIDLMVAGSKVDYWTWIDAIQMSMPIYAKLGVVYNDTKYYDRMWLMYKSARDQQNTVGFYNKTDHLWYRDKNFSATTNLTPNGKSTYWSRGNGWVFAALTRVLDVIPQNETHRNDYLTDFKDMAAALKTVQRTDGFWNVSLFDPLDYGGPETSGTAFFVYGMAWGINQGILDRATYLPVVVNGWNAMANNALHTDGFIGYMQGTGDRPSSSQPVTYNSVPNFEDYGLGAFLLAGSEVYKLVASSLTPVENEKLILSFSAVPTRITDQCRISYQVQPGNVAVLDVFDCTGRKVTSIIRANNCDAGSILWDGCDERGARLPVGLYIIRLTAGNEVKVVKVQIAN